MADMFTDFQTLQKLYGVILTPLLERFGLTRIEADILLFLANNPQHDTARDMVEKRGLAKSHVSLGVDRLVRRGMVERFYAEDNRKVIHLRLLTPSREITAEGQRLQREYSEALFSGFSSQERETLKSFLARIAQNAGRAVKGTGGRA